MTLQARWTNVEIGQVAELINGDRGKNYPSQSHRVAEGIPFINAGHLDGGLVRLDSMNYVTEERFKVLRGGRVQRDDILLCIRGTLGRVAIATEDVVPAAIASSLVIIRPGPNLVPRFLLGVLSSPWGQQKISSHDNGAAQPNVGARDVARFEIPLPPISTQQKIVAIFSAYDDLIENNIRRIRLLEEMAQRIYQEWFVDFRYPGHENVPLVDSELGPIPQRWTFTRLGNAVELVYGKALRADARRDGTVIVFGSGGAIGQHDLGLAEGPGIIVGRKGNVGSVHWSDGAFFAIDTTYWVRSRLPLTYCYYALREMDFLDSHAAVPGLSREQAYSLPLLVPDPDIAASFDLFALELFALRRWLANTVENLRVTRDLLLPRLIAGEIDVAGLDIAMPQAAA